MVSKPEEMANHQLDFYNAKVKKLLEKIPTSNRDPLRFLDRAMDSWEERDAHGFFELKEISKSDIMKLISTMSNSEAFGIDGIDSIALKTVAEEISGPLQKIIN